MEKSGETRMQDQIVDNEMQNIVGTVKKQVEGFYPGKSDTNA